MNEVPRGPIPAMMCAAYIHETGGTDRIEVGELPTPRPNQDEVLVRLVASEVNYVDLFVRSGAYATRKPLPFIIGRDVVGTVVKTGSQVEDFNVGDLVWCNSLGYQGRQGAFAEYVVIDAERVYQLPENVDPLRAVAALHTAATAYLGLVRETGVRPGETILVGGAAGGVGSAVTQLASAFGARVIATASPRDEQWCRSCGADVVLDYHSDSLDQEISRAAPDGIDIWWDTSGHHDFQISLPHMRFGGRIILMSALDAYPVLPVGELYTRDVSLHGFAMSNAPVEDLKRAAHTINQLLADGRLDSKIGAIYSLADAAQAHQELERGNVSGRIVVTP